MNSWKHEIEVHKFGEHIHPEAKILIVGTFPIHTGNPGEIDHPKPEQIDHLKGWRKLIKFAGEDFSVQC